MGKPCPDHDQGGALLAHLMTSAAKCSQLGWRDVLHLVDEQSNSDIQIARQGCDVGEELVEIKLEVTGVGAAPRRRYVDGWLPTPGCAVFVRRTQCKGFEGAESALHGLFVAMAMGDVTNCLVSGLGDADPDRLLRASLKLAGAPCAIDCH